jgi:hypothetical protein
VVDAVATLAEASLPVEAPVPRVVGAPVVGDPVALVAAEWPFELDDEWLVELPVAPTEVAAIG